ncbi:hypothetical protein HaLaN_17165, partial [Haematococcus lacustris]
MRPSQLLQLLRLQQACTLTQPVPILVMMAERQRPTRAASVLPFLAGGWLQRVVSSSSDLLPTSSLATQQHLLPPPMTPSSVALHTASASQSSLIRAEPAVVQLVVSDGSGTQR